MSIGFLQLLRRGYMRTKTAKRTVVLAIVLLGALGLRWLSLPSFAEQWQRVEVGMSREEVQDLVGHPYLVEHPVAPGPSDSLALSVMATLVFDRNLEMLVYGDCRVLAPAATFPYVKLAPDLFSPFPQDTDYVVYFGQDGRVVRKRQPDESL